jgi:hypothetical protein
MESNTGATAFLFTPRRFSPRSFYRKTARSIDMVDNSTEKDSATQQEPEAQAVVEEEKFEENLENPLPKIRPTVEAGNTNTPEAGG